MSGIGAAIGGAGEGYNILQENDRKNQQLALQTPGLQAQGSMMQDQASESRALSPGKIEQMKADQAKEAALDKPYPLKDILPAHPMVQEMHDWAAQNFLIDPKKDSITMREGQVVMQKLQDNPDQFLKVVNSFKGKITPQVADKSAAIQKYQSDIDKLNAEEGGATVNKKKIEELQKKLGEVQKEKDALDKHWTDATTETDRLESQLMFKQLGKLTDNQLATVQATSQNPKIKDAADKIVAAKTANAATKADAIAATKPDEKARQIGMKLAQNPQSVSGNDKAWNDIYWKQKTAASDEYGKWRYKIMMDTPMAGYDSANGNTGFITKKMILDAEKEGDSGRFVPIEAATKIRSRLAAFSEIEIASTTAKNALKNLDTDFTLEFRAKMAQMLKADDSRSAAQNLISSSIGRTLTAPQRNYVIAVANMKESAFGLRTLQGLGQGSDTLRAAMEGMVLNAHTWSKAAGAEQMRLFDQETAALKKAIPGLGGAGGSRKTPKISNDLSSNATVTPDNPLGLKLPTSK